MIIAIDDHNNNNRPTTTILFNQVCVFVDHDNFFLNFPVHNCLFFLSNFRDSIKLSSSSLYDHDD